MCKNFIGNTFEINIGVTRKNKIRLDQHCGEGKTQFLAGEVAGVQCTLTRVPGPWVFWRSQAL